MDDGPSMTLNPWRSIWLKPRATIRQIVTTNPEHHVVALAAAAGVVQTLLNAVNEKYGDEFGLLPILLFALVLAPIFGVVMLYVVAVLLRWTGRWLGGVGTLRDLRAAIAWGSAPTVMGGVGMLVALLVAGHDLFSTVQPWLARNPVLMMIAGVGLVVQGVTAMWSFFTGLKCVAEVQEFSAWKALGNYVLVIVIMIAVVFAIVFGVMMVTGK